jgi:hypothetical protein
MQDVYVLIIKPCGKCLPERISTVVSDNIDKLIDYVINEELPDMGWSEEDIIDLKVEPQLAEDLYFVAGGYEFIIEESAMI